LYHILNISLWRLDIIHGDDLITTSEECNLDLVLLETHAGAFVMWNLTEVTHGNVRFQKGLAGMSGLNTCTKFENS